MRCCRSYDEDLTLMAERMFGREKDEAVSVAVSALWRRERMEGAAAEEETAGGAPRFRPLDAGCGLQEDGCGLRVG